jgi:hypothetical protein
MQLDETAEGQQQQQSGPAQTRQRQRSSAHFNPFVSSFGTPMELDETVGRQQQQQQAGPESAPANAPKGPKGTAPQRRPQQNLELQQQMSQQVMKQPMAGPPSGSSGGFGGLDNSRNGAQGGRLSVMGTAQNGGVQNPGQGGGLGIMGAAQNGGFQNSGPDVGMRIRGAAGGLQPQAGTVIQQQIEQACRSGRSHRGQPRNQEGSATTDLRAMAYRTGATSEAARPKRPTLIGMGISI